jgi:hypothetical protein
MTAIAFNQSIERRDKMLVTTQPPIDARALERKLSIAIVIRCLRGARDEHLQSLIESIFSQAISDPAALSLNLFFLLPDSFLSERETLKILVDDLQGRRSEYIETIQFFSDPFSFTRVNRPVVTGADDMDQMLQYLLQTVGTVCNPKLVCNPFFFPSERCCVGSDN